MSSSARSEALTLDPGRPVPIEIRPLRNARHLRLRFDEASRTLRLTCPWRTSRRAALAWALDQREWIEKQLAHAGDVEPFADGAVIPLEGQEVRIVWFAHAPRIPQLEGSELRVGGPIEGLSGRIERFLKAYALKTMSAEVAEYAKAADVTAASVSVGDPRSRWGSCSSRNAIRLSWRLILAAPLARRYVVAHEVAHLRHLNHGAEFKALEARLIGHGLSEAKSILRRDGPRLRRIGRRR